ncbi:MAG: 50S ribosomal protein L22 [Tepidisphaerales bacterium]
MPFTAKHRFARISPRKARLLMDLVRGRDVDDALTLLRFSKKRSSGMIEKVIRSAVANAAEQSETPIRGTLYVSKAWVDGGPIIKRFMPKDRGKAYEIKKRTSHFVVVVDERPTQPEASDGPAEAKSARAGGKKPRSAAGKASAASTSETTAKA